MSCDNCDCDEFLVDELEAEVDELKRDCESLREDLKEWEKEPLKNEVLIPLLESLGAQRVDILLALGNQTDPVAALRALIK